MGCSSSAPKHTIVDTSNWTHICIETKTGNILASGEGGEVLCQATMGPSPDGKLWVASQSTPQHFVEGKASMTWTEKQLGGEVKFTVLNKKEFQELFDTSGSKCIDVDMPDEIDKKVSEKPASEKVTKPAQAGSFTLCAKAQWGETLYLFTGEINDRVNVINHKTGVVALSMSQWNMGSMVKFYTSNVNREDRASVRKDKQAARADQAYCGTRVEGTATGTMGANNQIKLDVKPEVLKKVPLSLFCACVLYSNFDFNGIDC